MTDSKLVSFRARGGKIARSERVAARLELADRIAAQAMRTGEFDFTTGQLHGAFEPWGVYVRDVKRALDAAGSPKKAAAVKPPPVPASIDPDLRHAVTHFAGLAGVPLPESWS